MDNRKPASGSLSLCVEQNHNDRVILECGPALTAPVIAGFPFQKNLSLEMIFTIIVHAKVYPVLFHLRPIPSLRYRQTSTAEIGAFLD